MDNIIRSNIDYLFMSKMNNAGLESIFEAINCPINKSDFYKYVRDNTTDH